MPFDMNNLPAGMNVVNPYANLGTTRTNPKLTPMGPQGGQTRPLTANPAFENQQQWLSQILGPGVQSPLNSMGTVQSLMGQQNPMGQQPMSPAFPGLIRQNTMPGNSQPQMWPNNNNMARLPGGGVPFASPQTSSPMTLQQILGNM